MIALQQDDASSIQIERIERLLETVNEKHHRIIDKCIERADQQGICKKELADAKAQLAACKQRIRESKMHVIETRVAITELAASAIKANMARIFTTPQRRKEIYEEIVRDGEHNSNDSIRRNKE